MSVIRVIGENIKRLMEDQNISLRELSKVAGVSHPTLKRYVEGEKPIDSEKLLRIANHFNKSFEYFFEEKRGADGEVFGFLFRADKATEKIGHNDIEKLKESIRHYLEMMEELDFHYIPEKYVLRAPEKKRLDKEIKKKIEELAYAQRRILNIEHVIPENYYEVFSKIGINVVARKFDNPDFFGASSYSEDYGSFIVINDHENIPEERKIYSLVHEYAHLLFHRNQYRKDHKEALYESGRSDMSEKVADKFAGFFLMPRHLVEAYVDDRHQIDRVAMKHHFKVSMQALHVMLREYRLITKEQSDAFWKDVNSNDMGKTEPHPLPEMTIEEKNPKLTGKMKDDLLKGDIGPNKIAEIFGMNLIDARRMLKNWRESDGRYIRL